jgi:hypothetical protein
MKIKMITDYEVEGSWSTLIDGFKSGRKCRLCGEINVKCPETDHYNSKFWELKRNDGLDLVICPNGCSEEEAMGKYRLYHYLLRYNFLHADSIGKKSIKNLKYDWSKIENGWISHRGNFIPCEYGMHNDFLEICESEFGIDYEIGGYCEPVGWVKIQDNKIFFTGKLKRGAFSKKVKNAINDYFINKRLKVDNISQQWMDLYCL